MGIKWTVGEEHAGMNFLHIKPSKMTDLRDTGGKFEEDNFAVGVTVYVYTNCAYLYIFCLHG